VGTFVLIGRNIDCCNYANALGANLWPGVRKHFAGKHFFSRMIAPVHLLVFTHLWKIENHILGFTRSAELLDKNIINSVWKVIKSHAQKELSAINF